MKKFVSGIIVGALLVVGGSTFADTVGWTGKKVTGMFVIETESGNKVADAAVIDGTSLAPVRAVFEAAGLDFVVEGKKIIIQEGVKHVAQESTKPIVSPIPEPASKYSTWSDERKTTAISQNEERIKFAESEIKRYEDALPEIRKNSTSGEYSGEELEYIKSKIIEGEERIENYKRIIEEAKAEIAELQK